jgi:hypothetical protein
MYRLADFKEHLFIMSLCAITNLLLLLLLLLCCCYCCKLPWFCAVFERVFFLFFNCAYFVIVLLGAKLPRK